MKKDKGVKVQITIPESAFNKVIDAINSDCRSMSSWFTKLAVKELERIEQEESGKKLKKIISLDI